ncbi:hypothetical protein AKJ65_06155 [candidate division MSBL1 archaeon SCGC-AAA259E19]|uniref:Uncharacterized protein n=1 Tax=candidate division MSBL1 archaeon SCGC-AAA259E19 TaxID=1698264 RepID=A0A133UHB7_9EURY|nr:hypothetical protein AKJ65_06155 [candidate division MSBL1 archaeon SCGC-AAA259E19]
MKYVLIVGREKRKCRRGKLKYPHLTEESIRGRVDLSMRLGRIGTQFNLEEEDRRMEVVENS